MIVVVIMVMTFVIMIMVVIMRLRGFRLLRGFRSLVALRQKPLRWDPARARSATAAPCHPNVGQA